MKNLNFIAAIVMLLLACCISYLGFQRDSLFNPPVITGIGFLVIAVVLFNKNK